MQSALTPKVPLTAVVANQVIVGMATTVQVGACEVLHNIIALLCLSAFYFTYFIFYNQKYSKLKNVNRWKKVHGEEICKRLDFLVFSDKDG